MPQCYCININDFDWDNKEFVWPDKYFYVLSIKLLFHVPMSLEFKISQLMRDIKIRNYQVDYPLQILLQDGQFKGNLLVEIKNPEGNDLSIRMIQNVRGRTYISRQPLGKIKRDVAKILKEYQQNKIEVKNVFLWYVNCPLCVTQKGYKTVIFVQIG